MWDRPSTEGYEEVEFPDVELPPSGRVREVLGDDVIQQEMTL